MVVFCISTLLVYQVIPETTIVDSSMQKDNNNHNLWFVIMYRHLFPFLSIVYYTIPFMVYYVWSAFGPSRKFLSFSLTIYQAIGYLTAFVILIIMGIFSYGFHMKRIKRTSKEDAYAIWIVVLLFVFLLFSSTVIQSVCTNLSMYINDNSTNVWIKGVLKFLLFIFILLIGLLIYDLCVGSHTMYRWIRERIRRRVEMENKRLTWINIGTFFPYIIGFFVSIMISIMAWVLSSNYTFVNDNIDVR